MQRSVDPLKSICDLRQWVGIRVWIVGWLCSFVFASNSVCFAQVNDEEGDNDDAFGANVALRGALPRMNRQQMEDYMYGSLGGSKAAFHKLKRESIRRELDRVNSICELTDEQWSKLNEAIEIDIQHIENRITSLLSGHDGKMTPQLLQEMQQKVWQFAAQVQTEKADKNAVWHKVLNSQLTKEQTAKIESDEDKKLANQSRTAQLKNLLSLQRKLGLNSVQRSKIEEWISQENYHGLEFPRLCKELRTSPTGLELLSPEQLKSLERIPQAIPLPMNLILPAIRIPIPLR